MALGAITLPGTHPDVTREHAMAEQSTPTEIADGAETEVPLVAEDLLVEEVSIDGMCGVY
jgi:mycofactocin precursor